MLFVGVGERRRALSNNLNKIPNWVDTGSCPILLASHPNTMANRAGEPHQATRTASWPPASVGKTLLASRIILGLSVLTVLNSFISQVSLGI